MKKAIVVINAYTHRESELYQPKRIAEELSRLGVEVEIVRNSPALSAAEGDFAVFLDKDRYAARALERRMRLFNRAEAIETCDDKMLTHLALAGFPMPETVPSLLCYSPEEPVSAELLAAAEALGYPLVVKECFGSLGRQVYLARDRAELTALASSLRGKPHLYQRFVSESAGRDLRVVVVGGEYVAAAERRSETDFRSNAELGGVETPVEADEAAKALSVAVAKKLRLDYCGIDLLFGKDGYLVCEVNSNAFFRTMERVTGKNIARVYAEYIFRTVYRPED